jgi:hypothetical protein
MKKIDKLIESFLNTGRFVNEQIDYQCYDTIIDNYNEKIIDDDLNISDVRLIDGETYFLLENDLRINFYYEGDDIVIIYLIGVDGYDNPIKLNISREEYEECGGGFVSIMVDGMINLIKEYENYLSDKEKERLDTFDDIKDLSTSVGGGGQISLFTSPELECVKGFFQSEKMKSNKLLKNIFNSIGSNYDDNVPFYDKLFKQLCNIIEGGEYSRENLYRRLSKLSGSDFEGDLSEIIKIAKSMVYESSFTKKGFRFPTKEEKPNESRIHNLKQGQLLNSIRDLNTDISEITEEIKTNIETFIKSDVEIHKYDIIADRDFSGVINKGDIIEVKDIKYSDSYLAEPLASPVKMRSDEIRKDEVLLGRYNHVIDNLYEWLKEGGEGESIGKEIINKMVEGLKGFFIHDNIFVPIENFEFYLSNVGQNNPKKHRRLAIRYHIKKDAITYQLQDDGSLKELSPENNGIKYIDKKVYNNLDYISEYVNKLLDL